MIKAKSKSQPQPEAPKASLAERIKETCADAQAYIESKVDALKAAPEGQSLPRDWLMMNTRALNGGHCHCRVALSLLEKEN